MKLNILIAVFSAWLAGIFPAFGQSESNPWQDISESEIPENFERVIVPTSYRTLKLDWELMDPQLDSAPLEFSREAKNNPQIIKLPMPDGSFERFEIVESSIMEPELATKFPELKTYSGQGIDDPTATIRLDKTYQGFHGIILNQQGAVYIDPVAQNVEDKYIAYYEKDHKRVSEAPEFSCKVFGQSEPIIRPKDIPEGSGDQLRTYRLAVATTGEFTAYHGGTVSGGLSAVVTLINRVNSIYEREVSVRLILIGNNNVLIYTNSATDPYTNNDNGAMLAQNHNNLAATIGLGSFDVGHVFGTAGGGVAFLGSACSNFSKGRGVSSDPTPIGDALAVRVVSHEFGHQFDANHTFNGDIGGCDGNRSGNTAYEPGSGSTIMSYAGLCGSQNVSNITSPYFHSNSYEAITNYTRFGGANNCANVINTGNNAPSVTLPSGGFFIPISTPFTLKGSGSDPDGDSLTFCWEQYDRGASGAPNTPTGSMPSFRSIPPTSDPSRTLPNISSIINNSPGFSEILPTYSRVLTFRYTARDNRAGGGGVEFGQFSFQATDQAGPFRVTFPNNGATWTAGTWQRVEWDVANTNVGPVNSFRVNILLSTDGGFTYPVVLATDELNIGSAVVRVPNLPGFTNRIRVEAADNIFFDISDENINIVSPAAPGFSYFTEEDYKNSCAPTDLTYRIVTSSLLGFTSQVNLSVQNLPAGAVASFSQSVVNPDDTTILTVSNTSGVNPGVYNFQVIGTATSGESETLDLTMEVQNVVPDPVVLGSPLNGATGLSQTPTFFWVPFPGEQEYLFELATSPAFGGSIVTSALVDTNSITLSNNLNPQTPYFWRISAINVCGPGSESETRAFFSSTPGNSPILLNNQTLNVNQWQKQFITINLLEASDGVSIASDLTYTIVSEPQNGFVELNNQAIFAGATFTQDDINSGKVKYQHNGSNTSSDAFTFTVENNAGGWLGTPTFSIDVTNTTSIDNGISGLDIQLYPNPARDRFNIEVSGDLNGKISFELYAPQGQLIQLKESNLSGGSAFISWNTSNLTSGMYFLKIKTQSGETVKKVIVQH